jgi:pyridoxal 5-phosphate dependent beta-lyase
MTCPDITDDVDGLWRDWAGHRPQFHGSHLDSAAAGRQSATVLQAVADHALRESQCGAYIAEADAADVLAVGRAELAALLGVPVDGLAFLDSASGALRSLLSAWPLPDDAEVAIAPSAWGPNRLALTGRGLRLRELAVDAFGRVDLERLEQVLALDPPALVQIDQVSAHRALVQPVASIVALCRAAGVPVWIDAAQALGHVDTATGADAVFATGRKWLCGPRGVAVLGVAAQWCDSLRIGPDPLAPNRPVIQRLEAPDAHVAGRVGLCTAVRELLAVEPDRVWHRLGEVGRLTREALADVAGWETLPADDESGAITAVRATAGQDVVATRARLLHDHALLTTASLPVRAPGEMTEPLLRVSPHVDCTATALLRLREALAAER